MKLKCKITKTNIRVGWKRPSDWKKIIISSDDVGQMPRWKAVDCNSFIPKVGEKKKPKISLRFLQILLTSSYYIEQIQIFKPNM